MTEPTEENAADAFCPAWDKVSDVFLYLQSNMIKRGRGVSRAFL